MSYSTNRDNSLYIVTGTKFLRLASRKCFGYGGNHQNKNKNLRAIYVPDGFDERLRPKYVQYLLTGDLNIFTEEERLHTRIMVQRDQAGAEALIVSYLTREGNLRKMFLNGIKPHVYLGFMFPETWIKEYPQVDGLRYLPIEKLKAASGFKELAKAIADSDNNQPPKVRYYYVYKQTCHSANYGIKAPTFMLNVLEKSEGRVVLTKQQASDFLGAYHTMAPEVSEWWRDIERTVRSNGGIVYNLQGYPLHFTQEIKDGDLKDVYSACPQSTVGCITNIAYTSMQSWIEQSNVPIDMLNNNHDSYLAQCFIGTEKLLDTKMSEFLEQDLISPRGEKFKMRSEGQMGFNWSPAKIDIKNPPKWFIEAKHDIMDPKIINKFNLDGLREIK